MEILRLNALRGLLAPVMLAGLLAAAGCGGRPETGDQMEVTDEEAKARSKLMEDAMRKSGAYPGME